MFGSNYAEYPQLLTRSLYEMNFRYRKKIPASLLIRKLQIIYVKFFGIPEIGFQVRFMYFQKALKHMKEFVPQKILDVGCGIGAYSFYLAKLFPKSEIEGWDINRYNIVQNLKLKKEFRVKNVNFNYRDITKKTSKYNDYDFIIIIDVLEHISDYRTVLKHIYSLLGPGGYLFIHTPQVNQKRFFSWFRSWKHGDHVREGFNPEDLKTELKQTGYGIEYTAYTLGFFGSLAWELNHLFLAHSLFLSSIVYPLVYLLSSLDLRMHNKSGLGVAILARKFN